MDWEITLLSLYLTSWKKKDIFGKMTRSWKGYPFEILDELTDEDLIRGSKKSKSVYLTVAGMKEAEELLKKYMKNWTNN